MENVNILLVEDNEGDILLTTEALDEAKLSNTLFVVRDGEQAIQFINKQGDFKNAITPDLILLDVNLPKIDGHEVLKYLKSHQDFGQIPIIMLTTSSSYEDINKSYKNHANCYIIKPVEIDQFIKAVTQIESFWIKIVKLPNKS